VEASCRNCVHCHPKMPYCKGFRIVADKLCMSYAPIPGMTIDTPSPGLVRVQNILSGTETIQAPVGGNVNELMTKMAIKAVDIVLKRSENAGRLCALKDKMSGTLEKAKNPFVQDTGPYIAWRRGYDAPEEPIDLEIAQTENAGHTFGRFDRLVQNPGQTHNPCAQYTKWRRAWQEGYDAEINKEV
jgi:hypothetical protein